ncbi:MAG TPA: TonB-dependent receptor [Burkholderiaceae bacterium]|nr:TonB-dependent receptor [Burkholderiaceae bacterium]
MARAIAAAGGGVLLMGLPALVWAQDSSSSGQAPQNLERVEITGSSIKRIANEGALPVQVVTHAEIEQAAVTTLTDLLQKLPAVQNFVPASNSVNGASGGVMNAALHALPGQYTLVLVNGRRVAPANGGVLNASAGVSNVVDLNTIPLAAVERVEILTDGASALYGSDAIAGVINIILKKNSTAGTAELNYTQPEHAGGKSWSASLTKGFGSLEDDKYNILASLSFDHTAALPAAYRSFSKTGVVPFNYNGKQYYLYQNSINSVPGNIEVYDTATGGNNFDDVYNPYLVTNGNCPSPTVSRNGQCRFDYAARVDDLPETQHQNGFLSGHWAVSPDLTLFSDLILTNSKVIARYAPPAQPTSIPTNSPLYTKYVTNFYPYLQGLDPAFVPGQESALMYLRLADAGNRADDWEVHGQTLTLGGDGTALNWDYSFAYTHSIDRSYDYTLSGYTSSNEFFSLINAGTFDPFQPAGSGAAAIAPAVLHQLIDYTVSQMDTVAIKGSRDIFNLPAGAASLGTGFEISRQRWNDSPSTIYEGQSAMQPNYTDAIIGGGGGDLPIDASRTAYGLFGELLTPIAKHFDATTSVRYDSYGAVKEKDSYDANLNPIGTSTQGNSYNAATYKFSLRFQPVDSVLLRGSYGTGFRAPTLVDISQPIQFAGNTNGTYNCPFTTGPLTSGCRPGAQQYDVYEGGNPNSGGAGLKPEHSKQWTVGLRVEPTKTITAGLDLWSVKVKDQISAIPEALAFANPGLYQQYFQVITDPIGQFKTLALTESPVNLARAEYSGIDFDITNRIKTGFGTFTGQFNSTYIYRAKYVFPGSGYQSSLGVFGADDNVIFRFIGDLKLGFEYGAWGHTLTTHYKSGYKDVSYTADQATIRVSTATGAPGGLTAFPGLDVKPHTTFDWQTRYDVTKAIHLDAGIKNITDRAPPLSLRTTGGNQIGYDGRYADPLGRTLYIDGTYKF